MATLTQTAYYTRKTFKLGIILLVSFFVLKTSLKTGIKIWRKFNPPPPPAPTVDFGKLPKIDFPEQKLPENLSKLNFRLETISGSLPTFSQRVNVYFMPKRGSNYMNLERATLKAKSMGFLDQPKEIGPTTYQWVTQTTPETTLEMDINTGSFHLRYQYENDQELLTSKHLPSNQEAAQEAKNFLVTNGFLADDLTEGSAEFDYLRFVYPNLVPTASLSDADFVRTNLFRTNLGDFKIFPPNPKKSLISFLFSGSRTANKRIVEIDYTHFPIEKQSFGTYPLKPINQAWSELQTGKGHIANLGQNENGNVVIREVYLAYYDSQKPQTYLQPIYVFGGDKNFFGYVSAIDPKWME